MSLANYNDLIGAVGDWFARADDTVFVSRIPDFISLAESRMQRRLDSTDAEDTEVITTVADQFEYPLPQNFKMGRAIRGTTGNGPYLLKYRTPAQFANEAINRADIATIFTFRGLTLVLNPTPPDDGAEYFIDYLARFTPLSASLPTNWILTNFPDAYLFGTFEQAAAFEKDEEEEARWAGKFNVILGEINVYLENQRFGGGPLQIRSD
ncbi:MAG: hypothetical protein PVI97_00680 [Candidatus Thiodiazotropha sp.]|jgi:hypothetical protein